MSKQSENQRRQDVMDEQAEADAAKRARHATHEREVLAAKAHPLHEAAKPVNKDVGADETRGGKDSLSVKVDHLTKELTTAKGEGLASVKATVPEGLRDQQWKADMDKAKQNPKSIFDAFGFNRKAKPL